MIFLERMDQLENHPEGVVVIEGSSKGFPCGSNCFSTALYVLGLTDTVLPAEYSCDRLAGHLEGLPFHCIESAERGDLIVFEYGPTRKANRGYGAETPSKSPKRLAHAAIHLGDGLVFQQDHIDGFVGRKPLGLVSEHFDRRYGSNIKKAYSPEDFIPSS